MPNQYSALVKRLTYSEWADTDTFLRLYAKKHGIDALASLLRDITFQWVQAERKRDPELAKKAPDQGHRKA